MDTKEFGSNARRIGFSAPGASPSAADAIADAWASDPAAARFSVCGMKRVLAEEWRAFPDPGGPDGVVEVGCACLALLEIVDSPVHVHGETVETYAVLEGQGRMIAGDRVIDVGPGSVVLLPPGVPHGLASASEDQPVRVLMTFAPGLAPKEQARFRDERIIHPSARAVINARCE